MAFRLVLALYRLLLPVLLTAAMPGWLIKMGKRGGFGSGMAERLGLYRPPLEAEPCGAVHVHAISVGEALLALKLIRAWQLREPEARFVLAVGTATGHAVACEAGLENVRVTYSPIDPRLCVARYLSRFEPSQIVLVEGEAWPNLLFACRRRGVPVTLVNARLSPRSERRYRKLAFCVQPIFSMLHAIAAQEPEDVARWEALGVAAGKVAVTGSLKFDPGSAVLPQPRPEFSAMLDAFGSGRPVILAASTHGTEDAWIGAAVREADPNALFVSVPRHAERRDEVRASLTASGFEVILRSSFHPPVSPENACLVVDSTGELRDWTAHAAAVVIGKSILGIGGQSPAEAILAHRPLLFGPHMENFEPLASRLVAVKGAIRFTSPAELTSALKSVLHDTSLAAIGCEAASQLLSRHSGATGRTLDLLGVSSARV
jgi:3-deoxy-D-manno-octulosonic-acid transferase